MCNSIQIPTSECVYDCSLIEDFENKTEAAVRIQFDGDPSLETYFLAVHAGEARSGSNPVGYIWFGEKRDFRWMAPILVDGGSRYIPSDLNEEEEERLQGAREVYEFIENNGIETSPLFFDLC